MTAVFAQVEMLQDRRAEVQGDLLAAERGDSVSRRGLHSRCVGDSGRVVPSKRETLIFWTVVQQLLRSSASENCISWAKYACWPEEMHFRIENACCLRKCSDTCIVTKSL